MCLSEFRRRCALPASKLRQRTCGCESLNLAACDSNQKSGNYLQIFRTIFDVLWHFCYKCNKQLQCCVMDLEYCRVLQCAAVRCSMLECVANLQSQKLAHEKIFGEWTSYLIVPQAVNVNPTWLLLGYFWWACSLKPDAGWGRQDCISFLRHTVE